MSIGYNVMAFNAKGKIKRLDTHSNKTGTSSCIEVLISNEHNGYVNDIGIRFYGDKIDMLKSYTIGDRVRIGFNIKGFMGKTRYLHTIYGFCIKGI